MSITDGRHAARPPGKVTRVLLAEDNRVNQLVARILLERMGCHVDVVENGLAACRATQNGCYDAVLMGCEMPTISLFEVARRRRSLEGSRRLTPVITISKPISAKELERALDGWIARPINAQ